MSEETCCVLPFEPMDIYVPVTANLSLDAEVYGEEHVKPLVDFTLRETFDVFDLELCNTSTISIDVLHSWFLYRKMDEHTDFLFSDQEVSRNALTSSINKLLSYPNLKLVSPTYYESRLDDLVGDCHASEPSISSFPYHSIQRMASILFSNPKVLAPFSNLSEMIRKMQEGLIIPPSTERLTLGEQFVADILNQTDDEGHSTITKIIFEAMMLKNSSRFSSTDVSDNGKLLSIPFIPGDTLSFDITLTGKLSVSTDKTVSTNLLGTIFSMFPEDEFNKYFLYDLANPGFITIKPKRFRIELEIGPHQKISNDPLLYPSKLLKTVFHGANAPIQSVMADLTSASFIAANPTATLTTVSQGVYNFPPSNELQTANNKAQLKKIYEKIVRLAKTVLKSTVSPNSNEARSKILLNHIFPILLDMLSVFTQFKKADVLNQNFSANTGAINVVAIYKSLHACTHQLASLISLTYNPTMCTGDFFNFAFSMLPVITTAITDMCRLISKPMDGSSTTYDTTYTNNISLTLVEARERVQLLANKKYRPHISNMEAGESLSPEEVIPDLLKISHLIKYGILDAVTDIIIILDDMHDSGTVYQLEDRKNYPEPLSLCEASKKCFDSIMSIDLITYPNSFMAKLFAAPLSFVTLLDRIFSPGYFDLREFCLNYVSDIDRSCLLEALTYGAVVEDHRVVYTYKYTPQIGFGQPTIKFVSNNTLDSINNSFTNSSQLYDLSLPLGQQAEPLLNLPVTNIDGELIDTINPTVLSAPFIISNKVRNVNNTPDYAEQVDVLMLSLFASGINANEAFSYALLNNASYRNIKTMLDKSLAIIEEEHATFVATTDKIKQKLITDNSNVVGYDYTNNSTYIDAISRLDLAKEYSEYCARISALIYYQATMNKFASASFYMSVLLAYYEAIKNLSSYNLALYNFLFNPTLPLFIGQKAKALENLTAVLSVTEPLRLDYGSNDPTISEESALILMLDEQPALITMLKAEALRSQTNVAALIAAIPSNEVVDECLNNYSSVIDTYLIKMNEVQNDLSLVMDKPFTGDLLQSKHLFFALILKNVVFIYEKACITLIENLDNNVSANAVSYEAILIKEYAEELEKVYDLMIANINLSNIQSSLLVETARLTTVLSLQTVLTNPQSLLDIHSTLDAAESVLDAAQADLDTANEDLIAAQSAQDSAYIAKSTAIFNFSVSETTLINAQGTLQTAEANVSNAQSAYNLANNALNAAYSSRDVYIVILGVADSNLTSVQNDQNATQGDKDAAQAAKDAAQADVNASTVIVNAAEADVAAATSTLLSAQAAQTDAQTAVDAAQTAAQAAQTAAQTAIGVFNAAEAALTAAQAAVDTAQAAVDAAQAAVDAAQADFYAAATLVVDDANNTATPTPEAIQAKTALDNFYAAQDAYNANPTPAGALAIATTFGPAFREGALTIATVTRDTVQNALTTINNGVVQTIGQTVEAVQTAVQTVQSAVQPLIIIVQTAKTIVSKIKRFRRWL